MRSCSSFGSPVALCNSASETLGGSGRRPRPRIGLGGRRRTEVVRGFFSTKNETYVFPRLRAVLLRAPHVGRCIRKEPPFDRRFIRCPCFFSAHSEGRTLNNSKTTQFQPNFPPQKLSTPSRRSSTGSRTRSATTVPLLRGNRSSRGRINKNRARPRARRRSSFPISTPPSST